FTLELGYLIQCVKEFSIDRTQRRFWHAGGSSSPYYINRPDFRRRLRDVRDALISAGLLPSASELTIIPTFCCQLYATNVEGLGILEEIVQDWRDYLAADYHQMSRALLSIRRAVNPLEVGRRAHARIDREFLRSMDRALSAFNAVDRNRLPVAHVAHLKHSH